MKVCNEIMKRIDEADGVDCFDFDIARHTATCSNCQRFASQRTALRELIGSTARVAAPVNFDAMLKARLDEAKSSKPMAWLNAAFYLRAGAATAALVVAVFVAQYSGLLTASPTEPAGPQGLAIASDMIARAIGEQLPSQFIVPAGNSGSKSYMESAIHVAAVNSAANGRGAYRLRSIGSEARSRRDVPLEPLVEADFVDSGAILLPGKNGERDITVPTVSVGAQPLIYSNASRQPPYARAVSVSF